MPKFPNELDVDDEVGFRDFVGTVVRRMDDAVAIVGNDGGGERIMTIADLDRLKDETPVSYARTHKKGKDDAKVEGMLWKAICNAFLEFETKGRTNRLLDELVWKVIPELNEVMLAEVRRLREEHPGTLTAMPCGVTPHELRHRLSIHEYRPRLHVIPGGKAGGK